MQTDAQLSISRKAEVFLGHPTLVRLVSFSDAGHRAAYDLVLTRLLLQHGITLSPGAAARADFFPMLDDNIAVFARTALLNAFTGRRTVGLFFRPAEALKHTKLRYRLKYVLFRLLKTIRGTSIITIMPFCLEPRFAEVAHDWIYDLQFWDIQLMQLRPSSARTQMVDTIRREAGGRRVVVALGGLGRDKGFDFFVRLYGADQSLRQQFLFVAAGKVSSDCAGIAKDFTSVGGLLIDRFVSDDELYGLYDASHLVWSCYAQYYNQASGVFGRALQFGRTCIVRRSAYMHHLGTMLGTAMIDLDPEEALDVSISRIINWSFQTDTPLSELNLDAVHRTINKMKEKSEETLLYALGARI